MKRITLVLVASLSLAAPVAAQSLSILLPTLTFPSDPVTSSTKGCVAPVTSTTCQPAE
ncbi:hypothetical protein [Tabrizicola thermarum]|uniref:hypothetical protein n=1 Tax=Tabrizicola thermarum TaxID=2670345 RepID=UPI0012D7D7FD|nr:hypothetical protein [Tabrizicola thermarum]